MKITTEEFRSSFHSLGGTTVGERRKNLFLLLNETSQADISELELSHIQPRTPLEEKFKVEALIYFKKHSDLIELLKSENQILISKILKGKNWILEEAFQNITGEQLVTILFPYISFSLKEKIVNKLALLLVDSKRADEFYKAVEKKYGLYLASKLLPACSLDLIMNRIKSNRIVLTPRQVQIVINKYPSITEEILDIINNNFKTESEYATVEEVYKNVFISIAKHDVFLFLKLHKKYHLSFHLGGRLTKRLVGEYRENIVKGSNIYREILHSKQTAKSLHRDFGIFFLNLFPKTIEEFRNSHGQVFSILKQLPAKMINLNLYLTSFEKVYGSQLWNHSEFVTEEILDMLNPSEREERIKIEHKPSDISEDNWNSYLKTEKSIPLLKKRFYSTSDNGKKRELVELLVKTCKINDDKAALLNVCKFMITRYNKDDIYVLHEFMRKLKDNFELKNLDQQHWMCINKLLQLFKKDCEDDHYYNRFYDAHNFQEAYIYHRLINNLPVKEQLTDWIKEYGELNIIKEKDQYEKQCLLIFCEIVPQIFKGEANESSWNLDLFCALLDWNKRHQDDQISLFACADVLESVKQVLTNGRSSKMTTIAKYFVCMKTNSDRRATFLNVYLLSNPYLELKIVQWLIQHEPLTVLQYIDGITNTLLGKDYEFEKAHIKDFFWRVCKNYSHLGLPLKMKDICLNAFQEHAGPKKDSRITTNSITALSYLMPATEFLKLIVSYYPSDLQADEKSEEGRRIYQLQKGFCSCLKNINPPSQALQTILVFCKGDYLKLIRQPLYSASSKVNEDKLPSFFAAIEERAVSVRKHAIHLTFRVLDKQQVGIVLNRFMESDTNVSIRKFIFKCAFNFFTANPEDFTWGLVMLSIKSVPLDDEEALDILMQVDKVPQTYVAKYVTFTWDILDKLPDKESEKDRLLNIISSDVIQLLPKEFCEMVIEKCLFKSGDILSYFQATVQSFTCKYIIYCSSQSEQEERLNTNFAILSDYILATWNNPSTRQGGRDCATNFLKEFCMEFLSKRSSNKDILMKFADVWNNLFKPYEAFDEYLHLQFTLIYIEELPLLEIGQKIQALCDSLVKVYGPVIIGIFCEKLHFFADYFPSGSNSYLLMENFVKPNSSVNSLLLAISILNTTTPNSEETKAKYNAIIEVLEKIHDPIIQLHLQSHFSGITGLKDESEDTRHQSYKSYN